MPVPAHRHRETFSHLIGSYGYILYGRVANPLYIDVHLVAHELNPVPLDLDSELDYVKEWYATNRAGLDSLFEVETGIHQLLSPGFNDGSTYLIDGRRVTGHPSQRGIYIRKGRKFVR